MAAQTHQFQHVIVFAINQHQIRLDMTITKILPIPAQRMINAARRQCLVIQQFIKNLYPSRRQFAATFMVAAELLGHRQRPHSSSAASSAFSKSSGVAKCSTSPRRAASIAATVVSFGRLTAKGMDWVTLTWRKNKRIACDGLIPKRSNTAKARAFSSASMRN